MKHCYFLFFLIFCSPNLLQAHSGNTSIEFVENRGQWDGPFLYKAVTGTGDVYLEKDGFKYVMGLPSNNDMVDAFKHGQIKTPPVLKYHAYKVYFEGANVPTVAGSKKQEHYYNYFLGNVRERWQSGIHPFLAMDYMGVYKGVDLHVASEQGNLKYDFIVQPGGDAEQINLRFDGVDKLAMEDGDLLVKTSVGDVREVKPYAYQYIDGVRKEVSCRYKMKGNVISYVFPKGYDVSVPLVIDPTVVFCTFTGSTADNWGFTATYDDEGNFYAGGIANDVGYPVSTGAFQETYGGGDTSGSGFECDMAIIKFNTTGANKIWATYIGGRDNDQPHSMIVDSSNNLIIAGKTYSDNYPVTGGVYDNSFNGKGDIVITKLNSIIRFDIYWRCRGRLRKHQFER